MISIKDFAKGQGCSETIVYRHIRNNKKELGSNVQKLHGKTWLTDEGAELIRSWMKQQPIVISDTNEATEKLREQIRQLQAKVTEQAEKIANQSEELRAADKALAKVNTLLLNSAKEKERADTLEAQNADLRASNDKKDELLLDAEKTAQKLSEELTEEKERRISFKEYWKRRKK